MNIENLELKTYKNYKELCLILGENIKTGKSKQLQLKDFERYFEYHKQGQKFIIDKIYSIEVPKVDERKLGNNSIYSEDIQELLLCVLYRLPSNKVIWGCSTLLNNLSMINSKYIVGRKDIPKLSKTMNIDSSYIYDFYNNTHSSLRNKLETALRILVYRSLITCEKVLMVQKESIEVVMNELGTPKLENGNICYRKFKYSDEANDEEKELIIKTEKNVLDALKLQNKKEVFLKGKWNEFNSKIDNELTKNNIKYSYYAYKLIFNKENIEKEVVGELGEHFTKYHLNENIISCLIKSSETRYENANKIFGIVQGSDLKINNHKLKSSENYVENNIKLVNELIKL